MSGDESNRPWHPSIDIDAWQDACRDPRVIIADGSDVKITVRDGHLTIKDGPAGSKRERRFSRIPRTIDRLVILGGQGYRTMEAERWLKAEGVPWVSLDTYDNSILAVSPPVRANAHLHRAQAYAMTEPYGLEITRYLLGFKLAGQAAIVRDVFRIPAAARMIDDLAAELPRCPDLEDCRNTEAAAAQTYWHAWADRVSVPFSPSDLLRVPGNWLRFTGRESDIGPAHRHATSPVNAMLNFIYRVAESECLLACHELGLSPQLAILHADDPGRDSMALDLIEAVRPFCDRLIFGMLDVGLGVPVSDRGRPAYVDRRWFYEVKKSAQDERTGQVKLREPFTHRLAGHAADIGAALRPHAGHVAQLIADAAKRRVSIPKERARDVRARDRAQRRVPRTSSRPARLGDGSTEADVIPDLVWAQIEPILPGPPVSPTGRKKAGRPRDTLLNRKALAVNVCTELLGIPYNSLRINVSKAVVNMRLYEWQRATVNGVTVWEHITGIVQGHGHLGALLAALSPWWSPRLTVSPIYRDPWFCLAT
jgi:CRISPR-associated endonuclease Cas1